MATKKILKNNPDALDFEIIKQWLKQIDQADDQKITRKIIYHLGIQKAAQKANYFAKNNFHYTVDLTTQTATNQFNSGRCWLFAAVNIMREAICKELAIDNFELSQSYLAFWDKFERANFYLEAIIATIDRPLTDRHVLLFNSEPIADGGQWDMINNIVEKYGVIPKEVMPDSYAAANTSEVNYLVNWLLRDGAYKLRNSKTKDKQTLQPIKEKVLEKIFKLLVICYGEPVQKFDFVYSQKQQTKVNEKIKTIYDVDLIKQSDNNLTPIMFYQKYVKNQLNQYVSLIHAPTEKKPLYRRFSFKFLNNVVGANPIMHHNVSINLLKYLALETLLEKEPLWFGADVSMYSNSDLGIWDDEAFDYKVIFNTEFGLEKGQELDYRVSSMNHAMTITGADFDITAFQKLRAQVKKEVGTKALSLIDESMSKISLKKWKIENSWGTTNGQKGYYMMSDSWFNKFVYQLVVRKDKFNQYKKQLKLNSFDDEAIILEPWDPIGTLA